jgi:uncharacterized protein YdcH (DUF465 family)
MSVQRFKSLLFKSAKIQKEIDKERQRVWPDWVRLLKLKKLRLIIKDRIENLVYDYSDLKMQPIRVRNRTSFKRNWNKN